MRRIILGDNIQFGPYRCIWCFCKSFWKKNRTPNKRIQSGNFGDLLDGSMNFSGNLARCGSALQLGASSCVWTSSQCSHPQHQTLPGDKKKPTATISTRKAHKLWDYGRRCVGCWYNYYIHNVVHLKLMLAVSSSETGCAWHRLIICDMYVPTVTHEYDWARQTVSKSHKT